MAKDTGTAIKFVIDTHVHADHVSSGRALAAGVRAENLGRRVSEGP